MYYTPTKYTCQLLAALLMALAMPLLMTTKTTTTAMALPVTSKPIENTAENLAWQAWIMLPPEQKQKMKSRKVTPKSIFTLPLRVECPEGHQQVDLKCIPTAIGSNAVLIDPNVLGLVLGNTPIDIEYDYEDDVGGDKPDATAYNPPLYLNDPLATEKSNDESILELRPPSKDEPLKFNIFQNKFPTDDYPLEDYSLVSNEGGQVVEKDLPPATNSINITVSESFNATVNVTTGPGDLISEASNVSKIHSFTTLPDSSDFNLDDLDAISLPASAGQQQKPHKISLFKEDTSIHLVTTVMDTESTLGDKDTRTVENAESDLESLLQTESLMPMLNHTTAATVMPAESLTLTTASLPDEQTSSKMADNLALSMDDEEMTTTLPNLMDRSAMDSMEKQDKGEFIRSVTMNSLYSSSDDDEDNGDNDGVTTLTPSTSHDEPSEETEEETTTAPTTIQLDDTTIIENGEELWSSRSTTTELPSLTTAAKSATETPLVDELKELLLQQEQALKDFEELQRMRKGQKDQHTVLKKSKVEPVEVLPTTTTATKTMPSKTTPAAAAAATALPTTKMDELITAETVTPLLTVHNNENDQNDRDSNSKSNTNNSNNIENNNNDRFYYQHFAKQDLESAVVSGASEQSKSSKAAATTTTTTSSTTYSETLASTAEATSEIDLAEELRLINELVKGKRPGTTTEATTTIEQSSTMLTTSDDASSSASPSPSPSPSPSLSPFTSPSSSENSASSSKSTLETTQIWSKILPLINSTPKITTTTTTTSAFPISSQTESSTGSTIPSETLTASAETSSSTPAGLVVSNRSHRNSKIIRIHGLNTLNSIDQTPTPESITTTTTEDISTTSTTKEESTVSSASPADEAYEPFWWLPVAWRLDKTTTTTTKKPEQDRENSIEEMPLLLRFWSTYHAPKSS